MNRPVTLIGIIVLILAALLYFTGHLAGDRLVITTLVGVLVTVAGLVSGR